MFALVRSGGRQYKVSPGEIFKVDKLVTAVEKSLILDEVLLISDGDNVAVGTPLLDKASVHCTIIGHERGPKVRVFRYKSKKGYRKKGGQRRDLTVLKVDGISPDGKQVVTTEPKPTSKTKHPVEAPSIPVSTSPEANRRARTKTTAKSTTTAKAKPKSKAKAKTTAKSKTTAKAKPKSKAKAKTTAKSSPSRN